EAFFAPPHAVAQIPVTRIIAVRDRIRRFLPCILAPLESATHGIQICSYNLVALSADVKQTRVNQLRGVAPLGLTSRRDDGRPGRRGPGGAPGAATTGIFRLLGSVREGRTATSTSPHDLWYRMAPTGPSLRRALAQQWRA